MQICTNMYKKRGRKRPIMTACVTITPAMGRGRQKVQMLRDIQVPG